MADPVAELRQRNRKVWASGGWDDVSYMVADVGPRLLDRVGVEEGMDVLDVGTGSGGTVAIPAALRGARVVGSDLTPELFDDARRRAEDAGVEVEWVDADAEDLPFEDASFDRVLSTFGHMFAPRHERSGAELARVVRPGGLVATTTWRPEGFAGGLFKTMGSHMPPLPDFAQPPALWGDEQHVREMLEPHGLEVEFDHETTIFEHEGDADAFVTFYEQKFGPTVTAKAALGENWPALRADLVELFDSFDVSEDAGVCQLEAAYLVTRARKPE